MVPAACVLVHCGGAGILRAAHGKKRRPFCAVLWDRICAGAACTRSATRQAGWLLASRRACVKPTGAVPSYTRQL